MNCFYILLRIGDRVIRALIDTGATNSVMTLTMAAKLGLTDIIDTRRQSECNGIGKATVLGCIFDIDIQVYDGIKLLEASPLLFSANILVMDSSTLDTILLGVDFLDNVDASINVRNRKISIFGKDFSFMPKADFEEPMLYTDLVKTQFASQAKKNDPDILLSILCNIETCRSFEKDSLTPELLSALTILGFDDYGKNLVLNIQPQKDVFDFALQTVCC